MTSSPVFPTVLGVVGGDKAFLASGLTGTAIGIAVTFGWIGLAVSSPIIGGVAGSDPKGLKKGLLVIPAASLVMFLVSFTL